MGLRDSLELPCASPGDEPPIRICNDPLPALPPRGADVEDAARAFELLIWQLFR